MNTDITFESIQKTFNCPHYLAVTIARILHGCEDKHLVNDFKSVRKLYHHTDKPYMRLLACNELLQGYGVFGVEGSCDQNTGKGYYSYLNTGETYDPTICYVNERDQFVIASYGDLEEETQYNKQDEY